MRKKSFSNRIDAKIEFRCCMDRLTRDLKLYRIAPQDLIRVSKLQIHYFLNYFPLSDQKIQITKCREVKCSKGLKTPQHNLGMHCNFGKQIALYHFELHV